MKNIDKIAHLDNMIEKLKGQIDHSTNSLASAPNDLMLMHVIESWKMDLAAMKFGRKAIQLMVDLVNDVEDEGGEQ